jgi:hypothetical protein
LCDGGHLGSHFAFFTLKYLFKCSNNARNEFLDLENILIDTKIIIIAPLEAEIWPKMCDGGHLGSHLEFMP